MKRLFVIGIISLVLVLTACKKDEETTYLLAPGSDVKECGASCDLEADFWSVILESKEDRNYDVYFKDQDLYDVVIVQPGDTINRDNLLRADKVGGNYRILPGHAYMPFNHGITQMRIFIENCLKNQSCDDFSYLNQKDDIATDSAYGFNEDSGYYHYTLSDELGVSRKESFKYQVYTDHTDYEKYLYFPQNNQFEYSIMNNGILYTYEKQKDDSYTYRYLNTVTYESIFYQNNGGSKLLEYYNPETELSYSYSKYQGYKIKSYQDNEMVSALSGAEEEYKVFLNFHFMNGWDQLNCDYTDDNVSFYFQVLNEGTLVFDNHRITHKMVTPFYNYIESETVLSQSEYDDYRFPDELQSNHSLEKMKEELEQFMLMDEPFEILPVSIKDFLDRLDSVENYLNE